jgi:cation:H+ antiporter
MLAFGGVVLGLVLLIAGGAALVRGATQVATSYGLSPIFVGLTIVAFGTSLPELFINVIGALEGATAIAFGNVAGSNLSNLGLVLGVAALIRPLTIQSQLVLREVPLLLLATTILTVFALDRPLQGLPATISLSDGIVLILLFGIFLYVSALDMLRPKPKDSLLVDIEESPIIELEPKSRMAWPQILGGFALLYLGGEMTIAGSVSLAEQLGISTTIVGLFIVAVGTSMPELVTSIIAATRGESDLAVGNVVGSNIFNALMVLPAGALIVDIPVPEGGVADLAGSWLFAAALIPIFLVGKARLDRASGAMFLVAYFGYAIYRVMVA